MGSNKPVKTAVVATVIGVGVGYALGILSAPKSGKETRQDLVDASARFKAELDKRYNDIQTSLSEVIDEGMSKLNSFKGSAQDNLEQLIEQAKQAEYKAVDVYRAVRHGETSDKHLDKALDQASKAKDNLFKYLNK